MAKRRVVRFCYPSNESHGRNRYSHQLRDGDAVIELMPALESLGCEYEGVFINWPCPPTEDKSLSDFDILNLNESDILLLTTRPPIDDRVHDLRPLRKSGTALEMEIFKVLEQRCFKCCSRKEVSLRESVGRRLSTEYRNRSVIAFEVKGQDAGYRGVYGGERQQRYEPWTEQMSAGYIVHVPLGEKGPRLLAVFGMSGTMTLLWAYRLNKLRDVLEKALSGPSFTMAEIVRPGPIPSERSDSKAEKDAARPVDFGFCLNWDLKIIGHCGL